MQQAIMASVVNVNGFTGREHSRLIVLLGMLALTSIIIWVLICLSILIRQVSIIFLQIVGHLSARRALRSKRADIR